MWDRFFLCVSAYAAPVKAAMRSVSHLRSPCLEFRSHGLKDYIVRKGKECPFKVEILKEIAREKDAQNPV